MQSPTIKKPAADTTRIGDYAAKQPLSGIARIDETFAVNGNGRGGFVRKEETEKSASDKR
jgi:hypothetical protein